MRRAIDQVGGALAEYRGAARPFVVGEPCFAPPQVLIEAFARRGALESTGYPEPQGDPALRRAIAELHAAQGELVDPHQIVITHGAKGGVLAALSVLLAPGDEIIHPVPCYPAYPVMAKLLGAQPVPLAESDGGFAWSRAELDAVITPRTRAVVLSSPSNPTGATLTGSQAECILAVCRERRLRLICDEAYDGFRYTGEPRPAALDPSLATLVQIRSFSKTFAVCGWRVGYVVCDAGLADAICRWQAAILNSPNGPAQQALRAAPTVPPDYFESSRRLVHERIAELLCIFEQLGLPATAPAGGFYVWLDVGSALRATGHENPLAWCVALARRHGIGLWPGEDFLGPGRVRVSAVAPRSDEWCGWCNDLERRLAAFIDEG